MTEPSRVSSSAWILGCCAGAVAVLAGAFGAHALKSAVTPERLGVFETAVRYQMYHALALIAAALLPLSCQNRLHAWGVFCWSAGTLVFSGSLYLLVLSGVRAWGAVTPLGGVLLAAGWIFMALAVLRVRHHS